MSKGKEKEKETKAKEWTCDWCCGQKTNLQWQRNCPFLEEEEKQELKQVFDRAPVRKYDAPGRRKAERLKSEEKKKKLERGEELEEEKRPILTVGSYNFHECPIAYTLTDRWVMTLISLVNWSEDMHTPLIDGGLSNYTSWYFECRNIIVSEQRKIENEEMESSKNKGSIGKGSSKGRKSGMGRKGGKAAGKSVRKPSRARRW